MGPGHPSREAQTGRSLRRRVLLCESDAGAAAVARTALEAAGYEVCPVHPRDATDLSVEVDAPDFAWVDVGSSSFEPAGLARRLAADRIPFVLTSAADDGSLVQRAIDSGAIGCFFKPLDVSAIVPAIAVWMARAAELKRLAEVEQSLRDALHAGREVSTAVGILMERHGLDAKGAFESLRRQARQERLSVRSLAARIVDERPQTPTR
jgi:AmiR/NasT family two-component response regulator